MSPSARHTLIVLLAATAYRLLFIGWYGPGPDESTYWDWARHLDIGYVENPPLVAYVVWLWRLVLGDAFWPWRLTAALLNLGCSALLYGCAARLFYPRVGFWAVVAFNICPMYSMGGGVLLVPETLLLFWTCLALFLSVKVVHSQDLRYFYLIGVVFGAGLLSKYPAILIPCALALFALISPRHRWWYLRKEPYLMVLIGLVMFTPVIYWNLQHGLAGWQWVTHRSSLEYEGMQPGLQMFWASLAAQASYHSPLLYVMLWLGLMVTAYRALWHKDDRYLLLFSFCGPVMIVFQITAALRYTLPHWSASGFVASYLALAAVAAESPAPWSRLRKIAAGATITVGAVMCIALPVLLIYPLTTIMYDKLQSVLHSPPGVIDPMAQAAGWRTEIREGILELRRQVQAEAGTLPAVMTHLNHQAALLSYVLRDDCSVWASSWDALQYRMWFDASKVEGRPVLFVRSDACPPPSGDAGTPTSYYYFDECTPAKPIEVHRYGVLINRVHLWVCTGYGGPREPPQGSAESTSGSGPAT